MTMYFKYEYIGSSKDLPGQGIGHLNSKMFHP